jgi:hypothetical protein
VAFPIPLNLTENARPDIRRFVAALTLTFSLSNRLWRGPSPASGLYQSLVLIMRTYPQPGLAVRCAACDCRGPRSPPKHENEKSSFGAGGGGADLGLNLLNHMDAAASWRKIPCHLPVPFVHSLEMKPRRERYLVFVGEPGDGLQPLWLKVQKQSTWRKTPDAENRPRRR